MINILMIVPPQARGDTRVEEAIGNILRSCDKARLQQLQDIYHGRTEFLLSWLAERSLSDYRRPELLLTVEEGAKILERQCRTYETGHASKLSQSQYPQWIEWYSSLYRESLERYNDTKERKKYRLLKIAQKIQELPGQGEEFLIGLSHSQYTRGLTNFREMFSNSMRVALADPTRYITEMDQPIRNADVDTENQMGSVPRSKLREAADAGGIIYPINNAASIVTGIPKKAYRNNMQEE